MVDTERAGEAGTWKLRGLGDGGTGAGEGGIYAGDEACGRWLAAGVRGLQDISVGVSGVEA